MNYLRKKLQAIMASADFKGYLREVTGTDSVTLTDCMGSDLVSLSVTGNAVQDGTPSPDAPVEVQGVGERTGNLFSTDENDWQTGLYKYYKIPVEGSTTLQVKLKDGKSIPENLFIGYTDGGADATGGAIWVIAEGSYVNTNTKNSTFRYISIYHPRLFDEVIDAFDIMLVEGSYTTDTMPPFEPYGYKVPVKVSGINLFDVSQITGTNGGYVQDGAIYVTGYPYGASITPEKFLAMTGLKEGDTFTTAADYEQVFQPSNPTLPGAQWIAFMKKPSAPADLSDVQFGTKGVLKTTTIPEGFNSDNYNRMYIYGGSGTTETGQVRAIYRNLRVYKGTYTADTMPAYEPYHEPQTLNVYMDKPLYGLKLATGATGYYTYQDDDGKKYLCDTIEIDFDKRIAKRTDNLKYRSLADVAHWSEYTYIIYDDVYSMFTINSANPGQDIKTYYTDTDGTNKHWGEVSIVSNTMPTDNTYPVNTTPSVCTGSTPGNFANCIRYWFLKTDVDAYTGDTVRDRVAAYWEDFCADRDVMALYITDPATTDISAMQDWDTIPKLWRGTAIATVKTTIPTKAITARYYATKKED